MNRKTITDIDGVFASGIHCGIKQNSAEDLAFIYIPQASAAAGVFTKNIFRAACVTYSRGCLQQETPCAVVINSGNANAATGEKGLENAAQTAMLAASYLKTTPRKVLVASTGIIGVQLPMTPIEQGLKKLLEAPEKKDGEGAARAILTTDTCPKHAFCEKNINGAQVVVSGIAKGSGMIAPNMATMLSFLVTNAKVSSAELQTLLRESVDDSFNMVSVDSDTSTNDMVLLFSTGAAEIDLHDENVRREFSSLLKDACVDLAQQIARDGEGAQKLIEVKVQGASSSEDARRIAKSIVDSPLVKTAICGADPNWGRIIMAVGKVEGAQIIPEKTDVFLAGHSLLSKGAPVEYNREEVSESLRSETVQILVDLNLGEHSATAWGCDLTKEYVDINTEYN